MRLVKIGKVYVAECDYAERLIPKAAKFRWHGGNCWRKCYACDEDLGKVWWTNKMENAAQLAKYADEPARSELFAFAKKRAKAFEDSKATDADIEIPVPGGLAYRPFQRGGIAYAMARENTLLADEMGLGKTIEALGVVNVMNAVNASDGGDVLAIVPATLRINWKREADKWLVRPMKIQVIEKNEPIEADATFVIINFDKFSRFEGAKERHDEIVNRKWALLIVDEAHKLKNKKAMRTCAILGGYYQKGKKNSHQFTGLMPACRRRLFLTGTPILNRPVEIHPLLSVLAPGEFGPFFPFVKRYCAAKRGRFGWDFSGASNLDELQSKLRSTVMVRRLKKDVLTELEPKTRQVLVLPPNGAKDIVDAEASSFKAHAEHLRALRDNVTLAHASGDDVVYKSAVAQLRDAAKVAFTEMSKMRHDVAVAKLPKVIEHVQSILEEDETQKIVVFAHHHDVVDGLMAAFGSQAVALTGRTKHADRDVAVDRFQNDPSVRVFVGSITAAGVGITLTASSIVVMAELDWVPANVTQAEDRCHRIGQQDNVLVHHLVLDGSIDARMAKTIVLKQEIADAALDDSISEELLQIPALPLGDLEEEAARMREYEETKKDERKAEDAKRRDANGFPAEYPEVTDTERAAALHGLKTLAGMCDGAHTRDGAGFNKIDTHIGQALAIKSALTDGQVYLAKRLLPKYHRQVGWELLGTLGFEPKKKTK